MHVDNLCIIIRDILLFITERVDVYTGLSIILLIILNGRGNASFQNILLVLYCEKSN